MLLRFGVNTVRRLPATTNMMSRTINTRPPVIQKFYDKMEKLGDNIDQECKPGGAFPFSIENPRMLALKIILFIGVAFNLPFYITYRQLKANNGG